MSLEASLTPYSLKKLTFALACLSRFGEDVHIQAVKTELVLSTLNSSKTSYAQFTFSDNFFESYEVEMATKKGVTCHLNAKALLGVFRSRGSLEKTAERCDIYLYDSERKKPSKKKDKEDRKGKKRRKVTDSDEDENEDNHGSSDNNESSSSRSPSPSPVGKPPPSRLNIKFICNNGFIKTHSLFISTSHSTRRPTNNTEGEETSGFKVTPKHVSEWMEPFPGWTSQAGGKSGGGGGQKKEGYLAWTFGDQGVRIGTWEGNPRADRLSTEFAVEADEFDEFYLSISPVAFGFPMREFKAITFLATQLSVPISCVFTTPLAPLYVTLSHPDDVFDATFTIMTQEVPRSSASAAAAPVQRVKTEAEKARRRSAGMASSSGGVASGSGSKKKTLRMGNLEDGEQQQEEEGNGSGSRTNGHGKGKGKERAAPPPPRSSRDGDGDQDMMDDANGNGEDQQQQQQEYLYPDDGGPAFDFAMDDFDPNQENQPPPPRHSTANNNTPLRARNGGKPPNEEPLFFPNSQEQQQQTSPPRSQLPPSSSQQRAGAFPQSQLSQAQMEDLGLGDLEEMDWGAEDEEDDEDEMEVKGNGKGKGKEKEVIVRREEQEEVDPEKTDSEGETEQIAAPRRESRVRVRESGKARRVEESESRSRSESRGRSVRGGTAMTDEGDLRVPATLREDENRFMFDKSDDEDDEEEEEIEEDSSREVSREELGGNGRDMSPEL